MKLEEVLPHFRPYDIVKIKGTNYLGIITEVYYNDSQITDLHQWNYSLNPLTDDKYVKWAWYNYNELIFVKNVFDVIVKASEGKCSKYIGLGIERRIK